MCMFVIETDFPNLRGPRHALYFYVAEHRGSVRGFTLESPKFTAVLLCSCLRPIDLCHSCALPCSPTLCGGLGRTSKSRPKTLCSHCFAGIRIWSFVSLGFQATDLLQSPQVRVERTAEAGFYSLCGCRLHTAHWRRRELSPKEERPFQQPAHLLLTRGHLHSVSRQHCHIHSGRPLQRPARSICYVLHQITAASALTLMGGHIQYVAATGHSCKQCQPQQSTRIPV